jgi:ParB-like chromosome segregation protein Spo0J
MTRERKRIVWRDPASLSPSPRNARRHSDDQVAQLAKSIEAFGFNSLILVTPDGEIVAGEGRWLASRRLGMAEVPTLCVDHLSADQVEAYRLADNRIALNSHWDERLLAEALAELPADLDIVPGDLGFDVSEIERLLGTPTPIENGLVEVVRKGSRKASLEPGIHVTIGEHRFAVERAPYMAWLETVRHQVGFDNEAITGEIRRRLGMAA